jgi:iron complex outermembrane recepter protein
MMHRFFSIPRASSCALFLFPVLSFAEDATPTPSPAVETPRLIIIGSNIPSAEEVGSNPVLTIGRDQIDKSGERTTEELLKDLTIAGPNGVPTSNNSAGVTPGASSISLRGFDPSDTLTLIDGKRVAVYPVGANATESFVDLNSIPRAAIESVDILKNGASAIYGADAVAGVVNIKLRHDYRGAEVNVEYGNTLDKDSGEFSSSVLFGIGDDNTEVTGVMNYYRRNSIYNRDRAYSADTNAPSGNTSPPNLQLSRGAVIAAGGNPPADLGDTFFGRPPFFTQGSAPAADYSYASLRVRDFNYNAYSDSLPDSERYGGFVNAEHKIFGDQLILEGDLFYQNVKTHYELAPSATGPFQFPGNTSLAIPPHSPGATLGGPSYADTGVPLGAFNPFNPFQQIISGGSEARLIEFGNRLVDNETDAFFSTLGLSGSKLFDGSWGYDASFRYSEIENLSSGTFVSASRFNRVLNAADPIFNPASSQYIGTTVPYNPFGDFRVPIATNASSVAFATVHPKETDFSKLSVLDLNIYSSELFKVPAGGFGIAFGGQFRRENIEQAPDQLLQGDIIGSSTGFFTSAGRKACAGYAEADLPVFSPIFDAPGFYALEFTAAVRFEEFLSNSTNVLVPKFGMRWQPFDESLTVRATWGEGFHEPSLFELFGSPSQGLEQQLYDPVKQDFVFEVPTILRGNPTLQPEDSRSFSSGIVYSPRFAPGLTMSIDLYDIESTGRVNGSPNTQDVINRAFAGRSLPGEEVIRDASGNIQLVEFTFENGGSQKARGVDFSLQYQLETRCGTFTSVTQATYLDSFQFADIPGATEKELRGGALFGSDEGYLKWRSNSLLDWSWHQLDLGTTVHYLDGFHEIINTTAQSGIPFPDGKKEHWVKQTWIFDVRASYDFVFTALVEIHPVPGYSKDGASAGRSGNDAAAEGFSESRTRGPLPIWQRVLTGATGSLGCNNVFGQDPPRAFKVNSGVNYPGSLYDSTGRFVYVSVTKKF